jgi:hypothetical protein
VNETEIEKFLKESSKEMANRGTIPPFPSRNLRKPQNLSK